MADELSHPKLLSTTALLAAEATAVPVKIHITTGSDSKPFIIISFDNGNTSILDLEGKNDRTLTASELGTVWAIASWNNEWFVTGGISGLIKIWDLKTLYV